ncbi:MAG: hypothetical protein LCH80_09330 [Proteobacteria bacterium]|nr:hypothetical protein [Pseudomonadota bacterium]
MAEMFIATAVIAGAVLFFALFSGVGALLLVWKMDREPTEAQTLTLGVFLRTYEGLLAPLANLLAKILPAKNHK